MGKSKKKNGGWGEWLKPILIAVLIAFFLRSFVFVASVVEGKSMVPTLEDGEVVLFNKFTYWFNDVQRGDVVIINRSKKNYVKRIIGLPGETISVENQTLYIDGEKYEQSFITETFKDGTGRFDPVKVPEDSYFVMGDNRKISKDSRNGLGFISEENIAGKSEFVIFPINEWSLTK
ncbi:signal peptidase I [Lentibacillus salicampi]|uniref:Signal peptidase I n=1 Tax=Lentibacillus salicampi TaxID=175306 RepID=A0A4Y9AJ77_9BACI|nr:signal peptidase I [Lentibacillus salicampi]TFJ94484.1 signal peptidase I [Lentibacillus salicampi]